METVTWTVVTAQGRCRMNVQVSDGSSSVVTVTGELTSAHSHALADVIGDAGDAVAADGFVFVDLSAVTECDSASVDVLAAAAIDVELRGRRCTIGPLPMTARQVD